MCKLYDLPAKWKPFLETKDSGLFPSSPDTCELPTASLDDPSQNEEVHLWWKEYTLSESRGLNHLLARRFSIELSARNDLRARAQTHNYIMEKLTKTSMETVLFLPREKILARNIRRCEGNIMYNEHDLERQKTPQELIRKWLDHCGYNLFREHADPKDKIKTELTVEREVGHLLHGLHPKAGVFTTLR